MPCTACPSEKVFARGLCQACYWRNRRRGTTKRKNVVNRGACTHEGCDRKAFSKNLCGLHYQRDRGAMNTLWRSLRSRALGCYPPEWDDFETFRSVIGVRPSPKHQLRRIDPEAPWSIANSAWLPPSGESYVADKKAYARKWGLKKKYGLTMEDFAAMIVAQGNACAISKTPFGPGSKICVDHDHVTGRVRGLLCDSCNKGLGAFSDEVERLQSAIAYLVSHAAH